MKRTQPATAVEIVAETLKQSIEHGTLKPGEKLPVLKQMEKMYGVSRIVIREAIKVLEGKGLLYSRQGSGIYVTAAPLLSEETVAGTKEYSFFEIISLFEHIYGYAFFALKMREDLSEILKLQALNEDMLNNYTTLTVHQKFVYEVSFGAKLVQLSENTLAYDLFLMLIKPLTSIDYMVILENDKYIDILRIDHELVCAILERDPYQCYFLNHKRNQTSLQAISNQQEFLEKRFQIFA